VANIGSGVFGGFCVTGTIARTATNVRAGSHGPVSGMLHSLFLLAFLLVAAPLAAYIPLAALAGVLAVVAWGMAERHEVASLLRSSRGDALVVSVTFLLVVFRDLTEGIVVGFALAGLIFIKRMSEGVAMHPREEAPQAVRSDRVVYHLEGPYFFGAAAQLGGVLDRIADVPRALVLDMSGVPLIDSSGARGMHSLAARARRRGGRLFLVGLKPALIRQLEAQGLSEPEVQFAASLAEVDAALDAQPGGESR
jgi:SulP family sulfate permease